MPFGAAMRRVQSRSWPMPGSLPATSRSKAGGVIHGSKAGGAIHGSGDKFAMNRLPGRLAGPNLTASDGGLMFCHFPGAVISTLEMRRSREPLAEIRPKVN